MSCGIPENSPKAPTPNTLGLGVSKTQIAPTTSTFPEGGLRAWATVVGAFLVQFCGFGYTSSFDFYTRYYLTQSSSSAISWIGSVNAFTLVSGGLLSGRLFDRGYFSLLVWGGSVLQCFSLFMLSLCKQERFYQIFLAQGLGLGIGGGMIYISSVAVVSHYFQQRRALAMTFVASGSSLGAVVHPIMLNNTFQRLGFGNAVRASAGLMSGLLLIACLLMRPRLPPANSHPPFWKALPRFARDTPYVLAVLGISTYSCGSYFPLFFLQLDAIKHGISQTFSFYSPAAAVGATLILCMIALQSIASVVVIAVIYGYCAGIFVTLMAPVFATLTDDMGELGRVFLYLRLSDIC
ncbi:MFS general substrate transporter [Mycena venus]|uniref:MFS general substrate transporter n=1 Tax=Mycena venus TaxID=2733690 RepID=A0A8H6Y1H7_9AGAR|nr:MFS general substrate transporter [Mycena venus]